MASHALDHHVQGLADDHRRAQQLADALRAISALEVDGPYTNMVFVILPSERVKALEQHMHTAGIQLALRGTGLRMVLPRDIDDTGLARAIATFREFFH